LSVGVDLKDLSVITDEQIAAVLNTLTTYNRPVFLRLEFDISYTPDVYISVWKKFHERIQANGALNVALVWYSVSCDVSNIADWYPGDEFVDWIGAKYECMDVAIQFARDHFKPVMLEASSQGGWDEWYAPFFRFVTDHNDVVRAVTYTNAGKSQLTGANIIKSWKTETKQPFWLRASPELFNDLGFVN
jgi:hypothetical protein